MLNATEALNRDSLLQELKSAVSYFEESSKILHYDNPARFCLPFYHSYFVMISPEADENEIHRYLSEAKEAVGSSRSRTELIGAVENLAKALHESRKLQNRSCYEISGELEAYRWFCDKAADHMAAAEESAPGAVMLMRKCNPLLEERMQAIIAEVQEKAKQICQITRGTGTDYETPGAELQKAAKELSNGDIVSVQRSSSIIVLQLRNFCRLLPEEEKRICLQSC